MSGLIEQLFKMSLTAGIVILVVLVIRFLMRKLPRKYVYMLWAAVGFRLLCPVSIESRFSLFNLKPADRAASQVQGTQVYQNYIHSAPTTNSGIIHQVTDAGNVTHQAATVDASHVASVAQKVSEATAPDVHTILFAVWALVAVLIIGAAVYHFIKLKIRYRGLKQVEKGIYESSLIASPFAMGIIRPAVYLPEDLSEGEKEYLIEHERTHIKRGDLIYKMIAVVALAIHWFNPLVWIAYFLFCSDMEISCDELVLEKLGESIRKNYSLSLVTMAAKTDDRSYVVLQTSFSKGSAGKNEVKMRIKNIMNFKQRSRSVAVMTTLIVLMVSATCVLNACSSADDTKADETITTATDETDATTTASADVTEDTSVSDEQSQEEYNSIGFLYSADLDWDLIENEDMREVAQSYADEGYYMESSEPKLFYSEPESYNISDIRYIDYPYGDVAVHAFHQDQENCTEDYVYILEGNEEIFNMIVDSYDHIDESSIEDDGNVITATLYGFAEGMGYYAHNYITYDRTTGIITNTMEYEYDPLCGGRSWAYCSEDQFMESLEMNTYGAREISHEDDGTMVTYEYYSGSGNCEYITTGEYNRDTGLMLIYSCAVTE